MTLSDILPNVRELTTHEKISLLRILTDEISLKEDISPLRPHQLYYLPTPYDTFGAGKILVDAMNQAGS